MQDLALKLLALGPTDPITSKALIDATNLACRRLHRHLSRILGREGSFALFTRSVKLASRRFPSLQAVKVSENGASLQRLDEAIKDMRPDDALEACSGIVESLLALLATFVGQDLTTKLVEETFIGNDDAANEGMLE